MTSWGQLQLLLNKLRCHVPPSGDVGVVGALGDYMIAGAGALDSEVTPADTEHRGVSFATGKEGMEDGTTFGTDSTLCSAPHRT